MAALELPLRKRQGEHNLVLLQAEEFEILVKSRMFGLPQRHAEHFAKVLRRNKRWNAIIADGQGRLIEAQIGDGKISAIGDAASLQAPTPQVDLIQAWIKPKALAVLLQKCAEIGARRIVLVESQNARAFVEKPARLDAILENACMQAYNPFKPKLEYAQSLAALPLDPQTTYFGDLDADSILSAVLPTRGISYAYVNGPEGGFTPAEIDTLRQKATGVLLSENVLRSESAAIIALGILRLSR